MSLDLADLGPAALAFLTERHLATLTTLRADGSPHVVPVGFTYDPAERVARVICSRTSVKAVNAGRGGRAVLCQVDGRSWISLEGTTSVSQAPADVADAEDRYARRYRQPRPNAERVVLRIAVDRALGTPPRE